MNQSSVVFTIMAIMAMTASLVLAVWRTITRPVGSEKFEDALKTLTGTEITEVDTVLTSGGIKSSSKSWSGYWYEAVVKTGRVVLDPASPGRLAISILVLGAFFGFFVFPGGTLGLLFPFAALMIFRMSLTFEQVKRQNTMERQLPMLLSSLRTQMTAGMTAQAALMMIADDLPSPLGDEMRLVKDDLNVSVPLDEALEALAGRLQSNIMQFLISSIGVAVKSGSDLVPQLVTIEEIVRQRARIEGKIKSALALAKPTAYLAAGMPILMTGYFFTTQPAYPAYFMGQGKFLGLAVIAMYFVGLAVINVMVKNVEKVG